MTLDSHGHPVATTGTQLRQQLRVHPRACQLLKDSKLFLVGLSGESVSDNLLAASLMKGAGMNEIIDAATAAATRHTPMIPYQDINTTTEPQELRSGSMVSEVLGAASEEERCLNK